MEHFGNGGSSKKIGEILRAHVCEIGLVTLTGVSVGNDLRHTPELSGLTQWCGTSQDFTVFVFLKTFFCGAPQVVPEPYEERSEAGDPRTA